MGPLGQRDLAVVDLEQRHEHLDPVQRCRDEVATQRRRPRRPDGNDRERSTTDFPISPNGVTAASRFLFATEAGTILGWAPTVAATTAIPGVDNSAQGAVYKGLTTLNDRLYATDFHNARVDVFDSSFKPLPLVTRSRTRRSPTGWAPFGIQALNGNIFVTYAMQDKAKHDDVAGGGLGYVDEYSPDGVLIAQVASKGKKNAPLNAPWGLAMAPAFGVFGGDLLVGNFGNGRIDAYRPVADALGYKGQLRVATARRSRSTGSGRSPSATAPRPARARTLFRRRPERRGPRALRLHRGRLARPAAGRAAQTARAARPGVPST